MFDPRLQLASPAHLKVYGFYERLYTTIDVTAALCFVVGSILFFYPSLADPATWFFLVGSLFFTARPLVRFLREFHLARLPLPGDAKG